MLHITQTVPAYRANATRGGFTFIIGVYAFMALVVLFCTLMLASTTVALGWYMLTSSNLHLTGLAMLSVLVTIGAMTGAWMLRCAVRLWARKSSARTETVILSTLLTATAMLMISALKLSRYAGSNFGTSLIVIGVGVAVVNTLMAWYLARPETEHRFHNPR